MLHRLIYLSAAAGVLHYYWRVKSDIERPVAYATVLMVLLAFRGWYTLQRRRSQSAAEMKAV